MDRRLIELLSLQEYTDSPDRELISKSKCPASELLAAMNAERDGGEASDAILAQDARGQKEFR